MDSPLTVRREPEAFQAVAVSIISMGEFHDGDGF